MLYYSIVIFVWACGFLIVFFLKMSIKITDLKTTAGSHQVEHAAQHGQQQKSRLGAHAVDGAHHCPTGGRYTEDECPDGVQVKLRGKTHKLG